jgi:hypothetical protein
MSTITKTLTPSGIPQATLRRLLDEGHGPEAWYGADITAATADVDATSALARPAPGRHNVAEIALHHAFWTREVRQRLTGAAAEPFPLEGEDWFEVPGERDITWADVRGTLAREQERLADAVEAIARGDLASPLTESERFDQVLGIAAHAAYHAGQIQLVKKLI